MKTNKMKNVLMLGLGVMLMMFLTACGNEEREVVDETVATESEARGIDLPVILYSEVFDQEPEEYFIYFWNASCPASQQFELYATSASEAGVPIFIVDMADPANESAWYDWRGHHEYYTTLVGEVENGEMTFLEGINEGDFASEDGWTIQVVGSYALAQMQLPQNNQQPTHSREIQVAGTPEILRIVGGVGVGQGIGMDWGLALLEQYGQ